MFSYGDKNAESYVVSDFNAKSFTTAKEDAIDLGLSVKWASRNMGASSPYDFGYYFSWGETAPYSYGTDKYHGLDGYQYYDIENERFIDIGNDIRETVYDVAYTVYGNKWRLPSTNDFEELINKCKWTWMTSHGANGYLVTGPNGNSIFLPVAGFYNGRFLQNDGENGYYWGSNIYENDTRYAWCLTISSSGYATTGWYRPCGLSVRAVAK